MNVSDPRTIALAEAAGIELPTQEEFDASMAALADLVPTSNGPLPSAEAEQIAVLIAEATDLRDRLLALIAVPVPDRDPAEVAAVTQIGVHLTIATVGATDEELLRLAGETGRLAQAAQTQRLAWLAAQGQA